MPLQLVDPCQSTAYFLPSRRAARARARAVRREGSKYVGERLSVSSPDRRGRLPSGALLLAPLLLELLRRQVAQRRMDSLAIIHLVQEPTQLPQRVGEVEVLRQGHLFFLDGPQQPLGVAVLTRRADGRHAQEHAAVTQPLDIVGGCVLHALDRKSTRLNSSHLG